MHLLYQLQLQQYEKPKRRKNPISSFLYLSKSKKVEEENFSCWSFSLGREIDVEQYYLFTLPSIQYQREAQTLLQLQLMLMMGIIFDPLRRRG